MQTAATRMEIERKLTEHDITLIARGDAVLKIEHPVYGVEKYSFAADSQLPIP